MEIEKPIFIVGSGRSGTSILYKLMAVHPQLCWFSNYMNKFPEYPQLSILHRMLEIPFFGKKLKKSIISPSPLRFIPKPSEAGNIYHLYCGITENRKLTEKEYDRKNEIKLKSSIKNVLKFNRKRRFISKQTSNNQRIRLINKIFPDAYFLHILRDGRAVANSLYHVDFWNDIMIWWFGDKSSKWEELGRDPLELCALHWKKDVNEILNNKYLFEDRYLEVRYEDLVANTRGTMQKIIDFCELRWDYNYEEIIPYNLPNMNYKWKEDLNDKQKAVLNKSIGNFLKELDYH